MKHTIALPRNTSSEGRLGAVTRIRANAPGVQHRIGLSVISMLFSALLPAQDLRPLWATSIPASHVNVIADSSYGCWLSGGYGQPLVFGPDTLLVEGGGANGFVARYDGFGSAQWGLRTNAGAFHMMARSGGAGIIGAFSGTFEIGDSTATSAQGLGLAITLIDDDGTIASVHPIPDVLRVSGNFSLHDMAPFMDGSSDVGLYGSFGDTLMVADTSLVGVDGTHFLARIGDDGALRWARSIGIAGQTGQLVIDGSGRSIITGENPSDQLPDTILSFGGVFVASFGADGSFLWSQVFGDQPTSYGPMVDVDQQDRVIFGYTNAAFDFGTSSVPEVHCFSAEGTALWSATAEGATPHLFSGTIRTRPSGPIVLTGWGYGPSVNFGTHLFTPGNDPTSFIATLSASGEWVDLYQDAGDNNVWGASLTEEVGGKMYGVGRFELTIDLSPWVPPVVSALPEATYVIELGPSAMPVPEAELFPVRLWPNPTNDRIFLRFPDAVEPNGEFVLLNGAAQAVQRFRPGCKQVEIDLDIGHRVSGLYMLQYRDADGVRWSGRIVKE